MKLTISLSTVIVSALTLVVAQSSGNLETFPSIVGPTTVFSIPTAPGIVITSPLVNPTGTLNTTLNRTSVTTTGRYSTETTATSATTVATTTNGTSAATSSAPTTTTTTRSKGQRTKASWGWIGVLIGGVYSLI